MSSTSKRWMNPSGATINSVRVNDIMNVNAGAESSFVGSNSETDSVANHFLQAVQKTGRLEFSSYDMIAAGALFSLVGNSLTAWAVNMQAASDAGTSTDYVFEAATCATVKLQSINVGSGHEEEGQASFSFAFKSNGTTFPLRMRAY